MIKVLIIEFLLFNFNAGNYSILITFLTQKSRKPIYLLSPRILRLKRSQKVFGKMGWRDSTMKPWSATVIRLKTATKNWIWNAALLPLPIFSRPYRRTMSLEYVARYNRPSRYQIDRKCRTLLSAGCGLMHWFLGESRYLTHEVLGYAIAITELPTLLRIAGATAMRSSVGQETFLNMAEIMKKETKKIN